MDIIILQVIRTGPSNFPLAFQRLPSQFCLLQFQKGEATLFFGFCTHLFFSSLILFSPEKMTSFNVVKQNSSSSLFMLSNITEYT